MLSELSLLYAHYDYWTGRAIRLILNEKTTEEKLETAYKCLDAAVELRTVMVGKKARDIAQQQYKEFSNNRIELKISDIQLKALEILAGNTANVVVKTLMGMISTEITKMKQIELKPIPGFEDL